MNRVLPAFLALVALLAVVAPAAGAGFSVSIPDQTISPGETVDVTPTTEHVDGLLIDDIPSEWDVSLAGGARTSTKSDGDTTEAKWLEPDARATMTLGIPDSANGTYELGVTAYNGSDKAIHRTLTITVTDAATAETTTESESGGLGGDTVDIETDTPASTTASGGADTTAESDADATTDGAAETTAGASATDTPTPNQSTDEGGPGFGIAAALVALALVARRR